MCVYVDTHTCMYCVHNLWLYAAQLVGPWDTFIPRNEKRSSATCEHLPSSSFLPVERTGKGQYNLRISSMIYVNL